MSITVLRTLSLFKIIASPEGTHALFFFPPPTAFPFAKRFFLPLPVGFCEPFADLPLFLILCLSPFTISKS